MRNIDWKRILFVASLGAIVSIIYVFVNDLPSYRLWTITSAVALGAFGGDRLIYWMDNRGA